MVGEGGMGHETQELNEERFEHVIQGVQSALGVDLALVQVVGLVVMFRGRQFAVVSGHRGPSMSHVFVAYTTADDGLDNIEVWREGSTIMEALEAAMDEAAVVEGAA
jgi:hypothetical protein